MSDGLTWMPAWQIRELIGKGDVSPVEGVEHFLGRISELNPTLRAFATVDADGARTQAKRAEDAVRAGEVLGPLHGIPISAKEHIPIAGLPTQQLFGPNVTVATRVCFSLARDHVLPASETLSKVNARTRTPINSTLLVGGLSL